MRRHCSENVAKEVDSCLEVNEINITKTITSRAFLLGLFHLYIVMLNVKYDFSSVHVNLPTTLTEQIIDWGKNQIRDDDVFVSEKDSTLGRENEIHITVLYGLHSVSANQSVKLLEGTGSVKATLGKIGIFVKPKKPFDVLMIEVNSEDLIRLNEKLVKNVRHTNKYGAYKPHVTIAYLKKGKAWKHVGNRFWCDTQFNCCDVVFSSKNGTKHRFNL